MSKSNYKIIGQYEDCLLIEDVGPWDKYLTVTNDAENVVAELSPRLNGRRLDYLDSDGDRSTLLVKEGKFAGFAPSPALLNISKRAIGSKP